MRRHYRFFQPSFIMTDKPTEFCEHPLRLMSLSKNNHLAVTLSLIEYWAKVLTRLKGHFPTRLAELEKIEEPNTIRATLSDFVTSGGSSNGRVTSDFAVGGVTESMDQMD